MRELLNELKKLNLPTNKFAIFGSGPLGIRGIRKVGHDIDIIVKNDLWNKLKEKYKVRFISEINTEVIIIKEFIEIYNSWTPWYKDINPLIDNADIIDGFPFVKLEYVLDWKKKLNREKDIKDVKLIEKFLRRRPVQVECFIFRRNNGFEFLLLKRVNSRGGFWQPVTGGLETGESINDAVVREVFEETGLKESDFISKIEDFYCFNFRSEGLTKIFGDVDIKEHVFGFEVRKDAIIKIDSKEHSEFKWVSYKQGLELLKWDTNKKSLERLNNLLTS